VRIQAQHKFIKKKTVLLQFKMPIGRDHIHNKLYPSTVQKNTYLQYIHHQSYILYLLKKNTKQHNVNTIQQISELQMKSEIKNYLVKHIHTENKD